MTGFGLRHGLVLLALLGAGGAGLAAPAFRVEEVPNAAKTEPARLKPEMILFSDHRGDELADSGTGLLRFEDWARSNPGEKSALSLYPGYIEPTIEVNVHGIRRAYKEKLHVYVAEARFLLPKAPGDLDLQRFATLEFLETLDPSIKHRRLAAGDAVPLKDMAEAHNRHPDRTWCEGSNTLCIASRYQLEGKLPMAIRLANKLEDSGKKIPEAIEFQSELRHLTASEIDQQAMQALTGVGTPVGGIVEQSIFHVNQMMQFGRFLAVFQEHPSNPKATVVSAFMALAVETDVLEKKKEYENVPVLRNMVPAQVLVGNSSFNTGTSLSAGLPTYVRNRIQAIAALLAGR